MIFRSVKELNRFILLTYKVLSLFSFTVSVKERLTFGQPRRCDGEREYTRETKKCQANSAFFLRIFRFFLFFFGMKAADGVPFQFWTGGPSTALRDPVAKAFDLIGRRDLL